MGLSRYRFSIPGHRLENVIDDVVGCDPFSLSFEIQDQAVTQRAHSHGLNVLVAHIETALRKRANFSTQNKSLPASWAAPEPQILVANGRGGFGFGVSGQHQANGIIFYVRGYGYLPHHLLQLDQPGRIKDF